MADSEQPSASASGNQPQEDMPQTPEDPLQDQSLSENPSEPLEDEEPVQSIDKGKEKAVQNDAAPGPSGPVRPVDKGKSKAAQKYVPSGPHGSLRPPPKGKGKAIQRNSPSGPSGQSNSSQASESSRKERMPKGTWPAKGTLKPRIRATPENVLEDRGVPLSSSASQGSGSSRSALAQSQDPGRRRPNPKLVLTRPNFRNGAPPVPRIPAAFRPVVPKAPVAPLRWKHQLPDGEKVAPLSMELPFILGPYRYVASLDKVEAGVVAEFSIMTDRDSGMNLHGTREGALLTVLRFIGTDWEKIDRSRAPESLSHFRKLLEDFESDGPRIRFWQEVGKTDVKELYLDYHLLVEIVRDCLGGDPPANPERYYTILKRFQEREIDAFFVPGRRFKQLFEGTDEELDAKIEEVAVQQVTSRAIAKRKEYAKTLPFTHVEIPFDRQPGTLYSVRFDHEHPTGKLLGPHEVVGQVTKVTEGTGFLQKPPDKVSVKATLEDIRKSNQKWAKWLRWIAGLTLMVGGLGVVVAFCYFRLGQKKKAFAEID
ncbi:hypothetical protein P154DRAFT_530751 [Amniculicola lignicola CBS 123094]|uniref:Uncharacterized protein n=1 Tax=Amniculicola lignicola CBS 123094 TaxID=1392246 RepID=A0A6A5X285_9PLEO|nr:hypothetical protein P154DRAFT_530751 [Amniculicola lignicola CBS 123094]